MNRSTLTLIAGFIKLGVWFIVALWCLIPGGWALWTVATADGPAFRPPPMLGPMPRMELPLMTQFMSTSPMGFCLVYALWCAAGTIVGFGFERVIAVVESMILSRGEPSMARDQELMPPAGDS